jgi:hypothetical protein
VTANAQGSKRRESLPTSKSEFRTHGPKGYKKGYVQSIPGRHIYIYIYIYIYAFGNSPKMAATKIILKLFIDKKCKRVLFAESNKYFVDFLFNVFTLPFGKITAILKEKGMGTWLLAKPLQEH